MGRRRIYENHAAQMRAYRARKRLRLEVRAFASLPLNLVQADPAAAAVVLAGELGPDATSRLWSALDTILVKQVLTGQGLAEQGLAKQALTEQGLAEQGTGLAHYLAPKRAHAPPAATGKAARQVRRSGNQSDARAVSG
jgi:hypothetical protein